MVGAGGYPPTGGVLALLDERDNLRLFHPAEAAQKVDGGDAPVHAGHADVLRHGVLLQYATKVSACN